MYITSQQAADTAGVSRQAIHKAIRRGELHEVTIAGKLFLDSQDLASWVRRPRFRVPGRKAETPRPHDGAQDLAAALMGGRKKAQRDS